MSIPIQVHSLRQLRGARGLTQCEACERMEHITKSTLGLYEQGEHSPDVHGIKELARAFNVEPNDILNLLIMQENRRDEEPSIEFSRETTYASVNESREGEDQS